MYVFYAKLLGTLGVTVLQLLFLFVTFLLGDGGRFLAVAGGGADVPLALQIPFSLAFYLFRIVVNSLGL